MAFVGFWMLPLMFVYSLFSPLIALFAGGGKAEIALPHDPENGIAWEYKAEDEKFIDFLGSEIKDGQQIFTFRNKGLTGEHRSLDGSNEEVIEDVCFQDNNGNIKTYFAFIDFSTRENFYYGTLQLAEENECVKFEYTVKPKTEVLGAYWRVDDYDSNYKQARYMGIDKLENVHERTYNFVFAPESSHDHTCYMEFHYDTRSPSNNYEIIKVTFEIVNKEARVIEEKRYMPPDGNGHYVEVE